MEQINDWTIIKKYKKDKKTYCVCRCKCGKEYERCYNDLKQSTMCRSCSHIKHGKYGSKLYFVWAQMKGRCLNKKNNERLMQTHKPLIMSIVIVLTLSTGSRGCCGGRTPWCSPSWS